MKYETVCSILRQQADMMELICKDGDLDEYCRDKLKKMAVKLKRFASDDNSDQKKGQGETRRAVSRRQGKSKTEKKKTIERRTTRSMTKRRSNAAQKKQKKEYSDEDDDASD
jgi:hypothetical protein